MELLLNDDFASCYYEVLLTRLSLVCTLFYDYKRVLLFDTVPTPLIDAVADAVPDAVPDVN